MVRTIIENNAAIIHIEKNVISEYVDVLDEQLSQLKEANLSNFIFDFHNIEYMCSSALGLIASVLRIASEEEGKVYFCSLSSELKNLFEVTRFLTVVDTANTLDDALNLIK